MASQLLWGGGEEPDADIWFVHGLRGNLIDTWSSGNVCWPRDLLKDDAPACRIFTWGYDSSVAKITQAASHATIFGHSESLLQDICLSRTSKDEAERPLVFVGHSLGGLVIKEALIRSSEYYFNEQDEELGAVYACTKGIVFLGTPHRGSELTPYGHIVAKVAKLLLRNPNDKLISLLETESPILERQRRSFASISKDIGLACVIEELPTALGIVVPEWSATIDGFNVKYQQVPANHMDMCKFATREEIGYKRVVFLLKNILKRKFHARQQVYDFMVNALLMSLRFPTMDSREDALDPAHRNTFDWIMEQSDASTAGPPSPFLDWLATEQSIFWLSGKAGSGKSTLMKFLVTHRTMDTVLQNAFPDKTVLVAWHYLFERGKDPLQKSREGLLRHLLYHFIFQSPLLAKPIFRQQNVTRTFNYQKTWSWEELKKALQVVLEEKPPNFELIFFVDGLDEYRPMEKLSGTETSVVDNNDDDDDDADEDPSSQRARTIAGGHQDIADLVLKFSRFDNVKVVVSSRPLLIFRDTFRPFTSIALHTLTASDISSYVADRLANNEGLAQLTVLRPSFEEDVKKEILGKADGVFLWVRLVLDLLTQGLRDGDTVDELLDKLRGMPKQLGGKKGLYMAMLLNLPVEYRKQGYEYFQMLQRSEVDLDPLMLSFAMEDPQVVFTTPIKRITDAEIDIRRKRTSDRLLSRCGGLLETRGTSWSPRINFIHQTAKEFAGKRSNWEHLLQTGDFTNFDGALALLRASVVMLKRTAPLDGPIRSIRDVDKSRWEMLQVCLRCARAAESLSAGPTAELLLLVDKTMFYLERRRLYQHPTSPPSQQRSSGTPNFDELLSNYQMTTHGGTIRRGTQYVAGHWSVVEPSEMVNPGDKNFIAVAVQSNLDAFVGLASTNKRIVDSLFHTEYPMLAYALVPHRVRDSVAGASMLEGNPSLPEMTRVLLELGLDPNQRYDGPSYLPACTVWEGFLANGDLILDPWLEGPPDYSKEADNDAYRIWLANARLLVQHGADPNAICIIRRQKTLGPPPKKYDRRSALYCVILVLWRTAKSQGWHEGLLQMMVERGARLRRDELDELLELAELIQVPEPFIRSVTEALSVADSGAPGAPVLAPEPRSVRTVEVTRSAGQSSAKDGLAQAGEARSASPSGRIPIETGQDDTIHSRLTRRGGLKRMGQKVKRLFSRTEDMAAKGLLNRKSHGSP